MKLKLEKNKLEMNYKNLSLKLMNMKYILENVIKL